MKRLLLVMLIVCMPSVYAHGEDFVIGADISWVQQRENNTVRYYHNGQRVDPFEVLKEHGFNYIRLRLFVDPTATVPDESESPYSSTNAAANRQTDASKPYCGLDSTVKMAKRIKAAGMKFLLDFHYSDTWTDPAKQHVPMSWRDLTTISQLTQRVRSYTKESLEKFKNEGVLPDMVQIGNENVSGMLWPMGRNYAQNGQGSRANFAALINAGIDGVKDVSGDIKIMVHTINERNPTGWLSNLISDGVTRINVFGLSYYSEWHGTPDSLERVASRFASNNSFNNITFCVVEYADNHRRVNDIIFNMPNNKGLGAFVWELFDWRETLFNWVSGANSGRHSNERLQLYPVMAKDYNGNTTSITNKKNVPPNTANNFRVGHNGIITCNSNTPGTVTLYTLQGKMAGRFSIKKQGTYNPAQLLPIQTGAYIIAIESASYKKIYSRRILQTPRAVWGN